MKQLSIILFISIVISTISTDSFAQTRGDRVKENQRGLQKVLSNTGHIPGMTGLKFKSSLDFGITYSEHQIFNDEEEWETALEKQYSYNEDRSVITVDYGITVDGEFMTEETHVATLNEAGLLVSWLETNVFDDSYYHQQFFYNEANTQLDSITVDDYDEDETYFDLITFTYVTTDSIRIYNYFDYAGETGEYDTDYALLRDGNYIEHYLYEDYLDRYTYYNVGILELIQIVFAEYQFYEMYNDELYAEDTEYIPYSRRVFEKEGEQIISIVEGFYSEHSEAWIDDYEESFSYDGSNVSEVVVQYLDEESFIPYLKHLFTYSGATSNETESGEYVVEFTLHQNYPNPFNPSTVISYQLSKNSTVSLAVFDVLGREVAQLVNGTQAAGEYEVQFDASTFNSGLYFYRLSAEDFSQTRRMLLLK
jgi:hypothetical protein